MLVLAFALVIMLALMIVSLVKTRLKLNTCRKYPVINELGESVNTPS